MPKLLISQRVIIDPLGRAMDALEGLCTVYFNSLGIALHPVSNFIGDLDGYLGPIGYDGLILSGGGDVNPEHYESKDRRDFDYSPGREKTEVYLIKKMIEKKLPILGICRGMYQLNGFFGGKVTVGIHSGQAPHRKPGLNHSVDIKGRAFGLSGRYETNHYHNDGIKENRVADCFKVFATDMDFGNVEGIIHKELAVAGIQWHPERNSPDLEIGKRLIRGLFKIKG